LLDSELRSRFGWSNEETINWLSPIANDDYAEYNDEEFLNLLDVQAVNPPLETFWPRRGACWDGLGRTTRGRPLLIEAKAYIEEMASSPSGAGGQSLQHIRRSLNHLKSFLGSASPHDWSALFYQYTNRLAHLYFLRELNRIDAYLVLVYFVGANDVPEPSTATEWKAAIRLLKKVLGLGRNHRLSRYIAEVFVDVSRLEMA
jgi:hypothetical protein